MKIRFIAWFIIGISVSASSAWAQVSNLVSSPNEDERWCKGATETIRWAVQMPNPPSNVQITLQRGDLLERTIVRTTPNDASHSWVVPTNVADGSYTLRLSTPGGDVLGNSRSFEIRSCGQPAEKVTLLNRRRMEPILSLSSVTGQPKAFETFENNAIEMIPQRITIGFDKNLLTIQQGEHQLINLPENSQSLDANGKLPVRVVYTLRNKSERNYRFHVAFRHGNRFLDPQQVTFSGGQIKTVVHNVLLAPSNNRSLRISIEATDILIDAGSIDVRPVYFTGNLKVRVYSI